MRIFAFNNFGYEGNLITVESDVRDGKPSFDITGLAEEATELAPDKIYAGIKNSGLDFPQKKVLVSLSPEGLFKEGAGYDLPIALSLLEANQNNNNIDDDRVLVLGELLLSGEIKPVQGAIAAAETAASFGIDKVICHSVNATEIADIPGLKVSSVENISQAWESIQKNEMFIENKIEVNKNPNKVEFNNDSETLEIAKGLDVEGLYQSCHAIETAVAGKHNLYLTGTYGSGKTALIQSLVPALTPNMTDEEAKETARINSVAGLYPGLWGKYKGKKNVVPFRMPHQTATMEGMLGGGRNARPGEISIAHNGILFLDEANEFRSSVLQMLRVPMYNKKVTLSKPGLSTTYPSKFQLMMAGNSCACGNFGSGSKVCLCSQKSVKTHTDKIHFTLLNNIEIKDFVEKDEKDKRIWNFDDARNRIAKAYEIQRNRGTFNADLSPAQLRDLCKLDEKAEKFFESAVNKENFNPNEAINLLKVSLTVANLDGRENIQLKDIKDAFKLTLPVMSKSYNLQLDKKKSLEITDSKEIERGR